MIITCIPLAHHCPPINIDARNPIAKENSSSSSSRTRYLFSTACLLSCADI